MLQQKTHTQQSSANLSILLMLSEHFLTADVRLNNLKWMETEQYMKAFRLVMKY